MPAASRLASLVFPFLFFSMSALHVSFPSVTASSPQENFIHHPSIPSNATLTLPIPWRIPNTSTSLQLRLGLPVRPGLLRRFLAFVEDQVEEEIIVLGVDAPLPEDGYDCEYYDLEFSAYSPPEPGHTGRMTWGLLLTIIEGLSVYLHDQSRNREAFFKVMDGPEDFFVGYGHLVLQRYLA